MITLVLSLKLSLIESIEIFPVSSSQSAKFNFKFTNVPTIAEELNVYVGDINSPFLELVARSARCKAEVQEFTKIACLALRYLAKLLSNSSVFGPLPSTKPDFITSDAALISSSPKSGLDIGILSSLTGL